MSYTNRTMSHMVDYTTLLLPTEQIACSVKVNGTDSPKALTKFSLGNGYSIVMGQFLGQASSVTAETVVPIQVNTSSQLFSAVYGYSINISQSSQASSGTRYALAQPNTKLIDAYCYAPGTQTGFSVGFIVFGKDA